ncbi:MAG: MFS transporter [Clostridiales bacterium]|nr:MFS transporter [Clostridiales bacterium]
MNQNKNHNKIFAMLLIGQLISAIGSGLTDFGLAIYVFKMTNSVMATSIVSICAFLPSILLAPIGGILADHYDRREMMILGELLSGLGLIICLATIMSPEPSFLVICIGVSISSVFTAFMEPAFKATISDLLTEEEFAKAGGLVQLAGSAKLLISPLIAGMLLQLTTVSTLIIIDILTFFITAGTILMAKNKMVPKVRSNNRLNLGKEMKEGLAMISQSRGMIGMVILMTFAVFCLGFVQILSKPLILAFSGEKELGILSTVSAFGMMAGSIIFGLIKNCKSYIRVLSFGLTGCGFFLALMGLKADLLFITVSGFMMFVFMPAIQIGAEVLIRKNLVNEVQGRAFGLIGFVTQMGYIVAYLVSGLLSDYIFEPFMTGNTRLAVYVGSFIGRGSGRGIGLMLLFSGMCLAITGILVPVSRTIKLLERNEKDETVFESDFE